MVEKSGGQWGTISPENEKSGPERWLSERVKLSKFARFPKDAGMFPA